MSFAPPPIPDQVLLSHLDACKELTATERKNVEAGMARFVEKGALSKRLRDHLMATAKAKNLFAGTEWRPPQTRPRSLAPENPGDIFSTRPGPVDPRCLVLPKRPPVRRTG